MNTIKTKSRKNWIIAIISIIVLLAGITFFWYLLQPKEPIDLFDAYFEPYEDVIANHSAEDSDLLTLAMGAYGENDFAVSMITLKRFLNEVDSISTENRTAATFYLAVSNLGTGNINTAKKQFENIATDENNRFQQQADWYIVLADIKVNNIEKAKKRLEKIQSNQNHDYSDKAKKLFKELL